MIRVAVEILTGTLFYVKIKADAVLSDLKKAIGSQEKLPSDRLILVADYGNVIMSEDDIALRDYGVEDGSHVYLFFRTKEDEEGENCHFSLSGPDFIKMEELEELLKGREE